MKIVFPDRIDIDDKSLVAFRELGVQMYDDTPSDETVIIERVRDAEIITANFIDITRNIIDNAPKLQFIISPAVGYEWIDYKYAASKGIRVLNCPTQNAPAVAEHALALMLSVAHRVVEADISLRDGAWKQQELVGVELNRKKLGLVGYGKIGKLLEQKASGIGMQVRYVNSKSSAEDLDQLLKESDVVCLCLALNDSTNNLINEQRLKLLKKEAIFINVARGAIVDEAALLQLLQQGGIRGAGLDVFQNESFTGEASSAIRELAKLSNVVATPHLAYNTEETTSRLGEELWQDIQSCITGNPINVTNN
jgi:D-3-phosphoglycerate dehydrogenase